MSNPFDQFDTPAQPAAANPFDQFDAAPAAATLPDEEAEAAAQAAARRARINDQPLGELFADTGIRTNLATRGMVGAAINAAQPDAAPTASSSNNPVERAMFRALETALGAVRGAGGIAQGLGAELEDISPFALGRPVAAIGRTLSAAGAAGQAPLEAMRAAENQRRAAAGLPSLEQETDAQLGTQLAEQIDARADEIRRDNLSETGQLADEEFGQAVDGGIVDTLAYAFTNPLTTTSIVGGGSAPYLLPGLGAARLTGSAGAGALVGANAEALTAGQEAEAAVMAADESTLPPEYAQRVAAGEDPAQVRMALARRAGDTARGSTSALASTAALGGLGVTRALGLDQVEDIVARAGMTGARGRAANALGTAAAEGATEIPEELAPALAQNAALVEAGQLDLADLFSPSVGAQAALGGLAGGALGLTTGAAASPQAPRAAPRAPDSNTEPAPPDPVQPRAAAPTPVPPAPPARPVTPEADEAAANDIMDALVAAGIEPPPVPEQGGNPAPVAPAAGSQPAAAVSPVASIASPAPSPAATLVERPLDDGAATGRAPVAPNLDDRINDLLVAEEAGPLTPNQAAELNALLKQSRVTNRVGGKPMEGVLNMTAKADKARRGELLPVQGFLDADDFKTFNDTLGHEAGDQVIRDMATALQAALGADNVFHRGGDEFEIQGADEATTRAAVEQARQQLSVKPYAATLPDGSVMKHVGVGFSYGVGPDIKAAEAGQYADKEQRKAAGLRRGVRGPDRRAGAAPAGGAGAEARPAADAAGGAGSDQGSGQPRGEAGDRQEPAPQVTREDTLSLRNELGWDGRGGLMIRAPLKDNDGALGQVTGRTKWEPKSRVDGGGESTFWANRPNTNLDLKAANKAFDKYERGEWLTEREFEFIQYAKRTAAEYAAERAADAADVARQPTPRDDDGAEVVVPGFDTDARGEGSRPDGSAPFQRREARNESGIPAGLPAQQTTDTRSLAERINRYRSAGGDAGEPSRFRAVQPDSLPVELRRALDALAGATGTRIVVVRNLTPQAFAFNGVSFGDGVLYLDESADKPLTLVAAHEWVHQLKRDQLALYQRLEDEVRRQGDLPAFAARLRAEGEDRASVVVDELTADAVADAMTDPAFLRRVVEEGGTLRRAARAFLRFLDGLLGRIPTRGTDAYLADVRAFRDELAAVLRQYENTKAQPAEGEAVDDDPMFQRRDVQTETPEFKRWSEGAPLVQRADADRYGYKTGEPVVVRALHGTPDGRFMKSDGIFKGQRERFGMPTDGSDRAFWFSTSDSTAKTYADPKRAFDYQNAEPAIVDGFVKMMNPLVIDGGGEDWRSAQQRGRSTDVINQARQGGHDGVVITNVRDDYNNTARTKTTTTYVVFSSNQIKSATNNDGSFGLDNPSALFSRRDVPTAQARDLTPEETARLGGKLRNLLSNETTAFREQYERLFNPNRPKSPQSRKDQVASSALAFVSTITSRFKVLQARYPDSKGLQALRAMVATSPGTDRATPETLTERVQRRYAMGSNRFGRILEANGLEKMTPAQNDQLREAILDPKAIVPPNIRTAANALAKMFETTAEDARAAGLEFGEVKDIGYLTRIYDEAAIVDRQAEFLRDAEKLYAGPEFNAAVGASARNIVYEKERLTEFMMAAKAAAQNSEDVRLALSNIKDHLRAYRSGGDLEGIRKIEAEIASVRSIVAQDYGKRRAQAWLYGILTPSMRDSFAVTQSPGAPMLKSRELSAAADTMMADWLITDVSTIVDTYLRGMARKTAFAETFGPAGEKVEAATRQMIDEGVAPHDAALAQRMAAAVAGQMQTPLATEISSALDWLHAVGYVAMLDKAAIASLAEPVAMTIRTRNFRNFAGPLVQVWRALTKSEKAKATAELAQMVGIITNRGAEAVLLNQLGGDHALAPKPAALLNNFFRITLLAQLTNSQRTFAAGVAHDHLVNLAKRLSGAADRQNTEALLRELGVTDPDGFAKFVLASQGYPKASALFDQEGRPTPMGEVYTVAVRRFVDQTIQNPNAGLRPELANNSLGRFMYGIMSFSYSFYENIIKREVSVLARRYESDGAPAAVKEAVLASIPAFAALALAQTLVSTLRELIFNAARYEEMEDEEAAEKLLLLGLQRSFGLGSLDPLIQYVSGLRYGRSAAETAIGAVPGMFLSAIDDMTNLGGEKNAETTTTTEYRAARAFYSAFMQPVFNAAMSFAPGGTISSKFATLGVTVGGDLGRDRFAELFGIPPERMTAIDEAYTDERKRVAEVMAEIQGRILSQPQGGWAAELDKLKAEYPGLLDSVELDVYADNAQNRRLGRAGMPKPARDGRLPLKPMEGGTDVLGELRGRTVFRNVGGRTRAVTEDGLEDQVSEVNKAIETLRENRDIAVVELQQLAPLVPVTQQAVERVGRDLSKPARRSEVIAAIRALEADRRELKREAVELIRGAPIPDR